MTLQVPVIRFFTGYGPFYSGTMGYSNALASFGIIMQVSILIGRIIKCALKNGRRYLLPVVSCADVVECLNNGHTWDSSVERERERERERETS